MLTGPDLGAAIERARLLKGVSKKQLAADFGVTAPSVQDWVKRGTIDKAKLPGLWRYFADVVEPSHWGLDRLPPSSEGPSLADALAVLGAALARDLPDDVRDDVADCLAKLARRGGTARDQGQVLALLQTTSTKRRRAA